MTLTVSTQSSLSQRMCHSERSEESCLSGYETEILRSAQNDNPPLTDTEYSSRPVRTKEAVDQLRVVARDYGVDRAGTDGVEHGRQLLAEHVGDELRARLLHIRRDDLVAQAGQHAGQGIVCGQPAGQFQAQGVAPLVRPVVDHVQVLIRPVDLVALAAGPA